MSLPSLTTHNHSSFIASHALVLVLYDEIKKVIEASMAEDAALAKLPSQSAL